MGRFIRSFSGVTATLGCALIYTSVGCTTGRVLPDTNTTSTVVANDATAMVQGCGNPPAVGIAYCRIAAGTSTDDTIYFVAPPADCKRDACAFLKVFDNTGALIFGAPFQKGETTLGVSWDVLLNLKQNVTSVPNVANVASVAAPHVFDKSMRGFWSWNIQVYWLDTQGQERSTQAQGDIVLRVYDKTYVPLQAVLDDPNFVWSWQTLWNQKKYNYRATSSLRAYVGLAND